MPGQPGHQDLLLAEFQAKMRARERNPGPDDHAEQEEKTNRGGDFVIRWAILIGAAAFVVLNFDDNRATLAVLVVLSLVAMSEVWLWHRRARRVSEGQAEHASSLVGSRPGPSR